MKCGVSGVLDDDDDTLINVNILDKERVSDLLLCFISDQSGELWIELMVFGMVIVYSAIFSVTVMMFSDFELETDMWGGEP